MRLVIVESPYAGKTAVETQQNIDYARKCLHACLQEGDAPFASHLLYTQEGVLNDTKPDERMYGILAGFEWRLVAEATIVFTDRGISPGMQKGIEAAEKMRHEGVCHDLEYYQLDEQGNRVLHRKMASIV